MEFFLRDVWEVVSRPWVALGIAGYVVTVLVIVKATRKHFLNH